MNKKQQRLIDALRSGKYQQCRNALTNQEENGPTATYCCLGVACKLANISQERIYRNKGTTLLVPSYLAMVLAQMVNMNDVRKFSFEQIADKYEYFVQNGSWREEEGGE